LNTAELVKNLSEIIDEKFCSEIEIYQGYVINEEVSEDREYADYLEEMHGDIEMFPLSEEGLMKYLEPYYYEETDEAKMLYAYIIKELSPDDDDSMDPSDFLDDLHDYARRDVTMEGIMGLVEEYEFPVEESEAPIFIGLIYAAMNNCRRWSNNGWTPKELYEKNRLERESDKEKNLPDNVILFPQKKAAKIGRNDPCPCGSGKKYKNCCGKNL
jgi:hypothetical protein